MSIRLPGAGHGASPSRGRGGPLSAGAATDWGFLKLWRLDVPDELSAGRVPGEGFFLACRRPHMAEIVISSPAGGH